MALVWFLAIVVIVLCAFDDYSPRTRLGLKPATPSAGGCGPKASHSAPPRADYSPRFVCGDCGQLRAATVCEACEAIARGAAGVL